MFRGGFEPWHIIVILVLVVLLFGSRKLPDAARSVGQSLRIFKSEMKAAAKDENAGPAASTPAAPAPPAVTGSVVDNQVKDAVPGNVAEQR